MTRLGERRGTIRNVTRAVAPSRLARVFDAPVLAWQRLETEPLDAAYYVLLAGGDEQVLWINQRATDEPKIARSVAAMQLLPGFTTPLIRADTTRTRLEHPYLITGYKPVPTLADSWAFANTCERKRGAVAWGTALKLIHRIRFDLAGDLAHPESEGVRLPEDLEATWQKPLQHAVKDYMLDTPKLVAALQHGLSLVQDAPVTLCHGHPDARSFLFDKRTDQVVAALNFGDARRSDPLTDVASILGELEERGCTEAFFQGYGPLSHWEQARLGFYRLHHELLLYARALTHFPNKLALSRLRLSDLLEKAPTY